VGRQIPVGRHRSIEPPADCAFIVVINAYFSAENQLPPTTWCLPLKSIHQWWSHRTRKPGYDRPPVGITCIHRQHDFARRGAALRETLNASTESCFMIRLYGFGCFALQEMKERGDLATKRQPVARWDLHNSFTSVVNLRVACLPHL
jgi:hypothetical protein